ncbi:hypothetical protein HMPREF0731_4770, partial [Pseudoroseomonas cervicalis ATCC 49957]
MDHGISPACGVKGGSRGGLGQAQRRADILERRRLGKGGDQL